MGRVKQRLFVGISVLAPVVAVLVEVPGPASVARAQDAGAEQNPGRFAFAGEGGRDLAVFDRATGTLYTRSSDGDRETATAFDLVGRRLAVTPLQQRETARAEMLGAWPARRPGGPSRYELLAEARPKTVLDTATGRLFRITPEDITVIDLVEGWTQIARWGDDAPPELVKARNETAVIGALKVLTTSQAVFGQNDSERDGHNDYGTLRELADATLIDAALGTGTRFGYLFDVRPSSTTPDFLWMGTARPLEPGRTGDRYFMVTSSGVIYYSTERPFEFNDECNAPDGARPVGR